MDAGPPLVALFFLLAACEARAGGDRPELLVHAATSARDALLALEADYEREQGLDLVFNFGGSGDLARQIEAAGAADVFLSADELEMDRLEAAGLLVPGTRTALLSNRLVVVEPADEPSPFEPPFAPAQLVRPAIRRLSLGETESVPVGRYARAWLEGLGLWSELSGRVLPAVDARAALAAVESGGAQAGIVYGSDAARSTRVRLVHAVPLAEGPRIVYPLAVVGGRPAEREARALVAFLASPRARQAFEQAGFVFLPDG